MDWSHPFRNDYGTGIRQSHKRIGDIEISMADRQPCPVCGHPTGDCTSETTELPKTKLLGPMNSTEPLILVEEDFTEERNLTPYTKTRVLIHSKGSYITLSRARELGLMDK